MIKRLIALSVGALAIALIATGCGGGDDDSGEAVTTSSLSKAEFIEQADAVCKKSDRKIEAEFTAYLKENALDETQETEAETNKAAAEIVETILIPSTREEADQIRALGAPSGDEEEIEEMVDALDKALDRSEEDPATALKTTTEIFAPAKALAEEYGLEVCGY